MSTQPADPATDLAHRLITSEALDGSRPFMLHGHPFLPATNKRVVRACFYYALVVGEKITQLFDNEGRGGMCDLAATEVRAIWRTEELLAALGTTFAAIEDGTAILTDVPIPAPVYTWDSLATKFYKAA